MAPFLVAVADNAKALSSPEVAGLLGVSVASLLTSLGQAIAAHVKGRRGRRTGERELTEIKHLLTTSIAEQNHTNMLTEGRITGLYYIITGSANEDGENGLRSQVRDHEARLRIREKAS